MRPGEQTKLLREVPATAIPAGSPLILPKDTEVTLTQSLGGSHTVAGAFGLARIEEKDQMLWVWQRCRLPMWPWIRTSLRMRKKFGIS